MSIELVDNPNSDPVEAAFDLIEQKIKEGYRFDNRMKDIAILTTIDAIPDMERPWFLEVCDMNRIRYWQCLWGHWRRVKEWGVSQAPLLDPGWEEAGSGMPHALEEIPCGFCGITFKQTNRGQKFCSNQCGADAEKAAKLVELQQQQSIRVAPLGPKVMEQAKKELMTPSRLFEDIREISLDEGESVRLKDDFADTQGN